MSLIGGLRLPTQCHTAHAAVHVASPASNGTHWANLFMAIGGVATAGALLVSLILLRQQMRDQRRARRDRRIQHATQVSFWLGFWEVVILSDPDHPNAPEVKMEAHIANLATQPAMAPLVIVGVRRDLWAKAQAASTRPIEEGTMDWPHPEAIGPGGKANIILNVPLPVPVAYELDKLQEAAIIGELRFTDAYGVGWVRTSDGKLIERNSARWTSVMHLSLSERHARLTQESAAGGGLRTRLVRRLLDYLARGET